MQVIISKILDEVDLATGKRSLKARLANGRAGVSLPLSQDQAAIIIGLANHVSTDPADVEPAPRAASAPSADPFLDDDDDQDVLIVGRHDPDDDDDDDDDDGLL